MLRGASIAYIERYAELQFRFDASDDKVPCVRLQRPSFSPSLVGVPIEGLHVPGYAYCRKMMMLPVSLIDTFFRIRRSRTVVGGHRQMFLENAGLKKLLASISGARLVAF